MIFKRNILPIKKVKWLNKYYPKYCSINSSTLTVFTTQHSKDLPKQTVSKNWLSMADSIYTALTISRKKN